MVVLQGVLHVINKGMFTSITCRITCCITRCITFALYSFKNSNIMANEIKFRWVGRNRKFGDIAINSDLTTAKLLDGSVQSFFNISNRGESGNCEFLSEDLFTGKQDKNRVDIYEGDIIRLKGGRKPRNEEREYYNTVVVFDNGVFKAKENKSIWVDSATIGFVCEVIGNIYENPELLK